MDTEQQWVIIGQGLDTLEQQLLAVTDDSPHAAQALSILNNVRACKLSWVGLGQRGAGRPQGLFPLCEDQSAFCASLYALMEGHLHADGKAFEIPNVGQLKPSEFLALLYDACVQSGVASGADDLMAYYNVVKAEAQRFLGEVRFSMAYKTLAGQVSKWADYVPSTQSRVFLHNISQQDVTNRSLRQQLSLEKFKLQHVRDLARQFGLIPPLDEAKLQQLRQEGEEKMVN